MAPASRVLPRSCLSPAEWDRFVTLQPDGWCWHLSAWLDYQVAAGRDDASVAEVERGGGEVVGLCPILRPDAPADPSPRPLGSIWGPSWAVRSQPQRERTPRGFVTRVVDLSRPLPELWADIRKSYHAVIHRAEERYTVERALQIDTLRDLYTIRGDLPQLTEGQWECLGRLLGRGILRIYAALDEQRYPRGATAVYAWKGWAYYGHGRSLETGAAHLLQWAIIKALREEGWPYYEVGWTAHDNDDDKARAIAHFKAGFGGEDWWVPVVGGEG